PRCAWDRRSPWPWRRTAWCRSPSRGRSGCWSATRPACRRARARGRWRRRTRSRDTAGETAPAGTSGRRPRESAASAVRLPEKAHAAPYLGHRAAREGARLTRTTAQQVQHPARLRAQRLGPLADGCERRYHIVRQHPFAVEAAPPRRPAVVRHQRDRVGRGEALVDREDVADVRITRILTGDPRRVTRKDPGNPDICNIFTIHQGFSPPDTITLVAHNCRTAGWGCLDCKRVLADNMIAALTPIRERAEALRAEPRRVLDLLRSGAGKARALARRTMAQVRRRMGFLGEADG